MDGWVAGSIPGAAGVGSAAGAGGWPLVVWRCASPSWPPEPTEQPCAGSGACRKGTYRFPVTRLERRIAAPASAIYGALLDALAVQQWMVPDGMTSAVHAFEPREGGYFRISLTYEQPTATGKSSAQTDTFHGRFVRLVPHSEVVQAVEFETADPSMQGVMTSATSSGSTVT